MGFVIFGYAVPVDFLVFAQMFVRKGTSDDKLFRHQCPQLQSKTQFPSSLPLPSADHVKNPHVKKGLQIRAKNSHY